MDTPRAGWSARALARRTGIPVATVIKWVASGLVKAECEGRGRNGHTIGVTGLLELLAVQDLRGAGISVKSIRRAMENLRELSGHERPLARLILVVIGSDIVWQDSEHIFGVPISALHKPGQRLMVFPVGERHCQLVHELEEDISILSELPIESLLITSDATR